MKNFTKLVILTVFALLARPGFSQTELASGYYVVVAAYDDTREDFAKRFTEQLKSKGHSAQYGFNSSRNLFFVYLNYFTELKPSLKDMLSVRQKGEFTDAWVRVVHGDISGATATQETKQEVKPEPVVAPVVQPEPVKEPATEKPVAEQAVVAPVAEEEPIQPEEKIVQYKQMTSGEYRSFSQPFLWNKERVVRWRSASD
jgi:hypothetical protein